MWHANIIAGVIVFLLGIATTISAWMTLPYSADFGPGPGFLPFWLGISLTVFSIPVIITDIRSKERLGKSSRPGTRKCVEVLIMIVTVFLLTPFSGFSTGLSLITAGTMRLMGKHSWISCFMTALLTAACIHYIFGQWLSIPLPQGMIGW